MFQSVILDFYCRAAQFSLSKSLPFPSTGQEFRIYYANSHENWFVFQSPGFQTVAIMILLVFCYSLQYFFQDTLIVWLSAKAIKWIGERKRASAIDG